MKTQSADFATSKNKDTLRIGTTTILQPKIQFKGGTVPWYDDTKLLKKNHTKNGGKMI